VAIEMRYGDYVKEGWEVVSANMVPSLVAGACAMLVPVVNGLIFVNYLAAAKAFKREGKAIDIGGLFNFENTADKIIGPLVAGVVIVVGYNVFVIPGLIAAGFLFWLPPILADRPGAGWMQALKASITFAKANPVPSILVSLALSLVAGLGCLCCIGGFVTIPMAMAGTWLCYADHQAALQAAAATDGIQL